LMWSAVLAGRTDAFKGATSTEVAFNGHLRLLGNLRFRG
jgi:hypothetical protein